MSKPQGKLLVVEDDATARGLLVDALRAEGYEVEQAADGAEAITLGRRRKFDVVLTDLRMPNGDGLAVLRDFRQHSPDTSVVMLTAFGSLEGAIEAIKQGAYDFLAKPFNREQVKTIVMRSMERAHLIRDRAPLKEEPHERHEVLPLVGSSAAMLEVYKLIARVASGKSTVLIEGESGTGKELVARAMHANSPRCAHPFVPVNCAALPDTLLESELFGHEKGAFTGAAFAKKGLFETAQGGTLFLDEIGDVGAALQVKLLRVIQEQEVRRVGGTATAKIDVRLIAATNRDLARSVREGTFREDLYYRLNVVRIHLPPLRERREDIHFLAHHFLEKFAPAAAHPIEGFVKETIQTLQEYPWPGNVRELENVIERAVSLAVDTLILPNDLPEEVRGGAAAGAAVSDRELVTLDEMEKRYLLRVLRETEGNKVKAAKILGIDRRTLYRMAERFGVQFGEETSE